MHGPMSHFLSPSPPAFAVVAVLLLDPPSPSAVDFPSLSFVVGESFLISMIYMTRIRLYIRSYKIKQAG